MEDADIKKTEVEDVVIDENNANKEGEEKPLSKRKLKKSRTICNYWLKGKCTKGDKCPYKHTKDESVDIPVCRYAISGKCKNGDDCPFSHDLKRVKCMYFKYGSCDKGEECPYSHDFEPLSVKIAKRTADDIAELAAENAKREAKKAKLEAKKKAKADKKAKPLDVVEVPLVEEKAQKKSDE